MNYIGYANDTIAFGSEDGFEKLNIDMSEEEVNKQYNQIISLPEVKEASEKLNMFKYIFQND